MSPGPVLFDTHAHLHFPEFDGDLPAVLQRARAAGVKWILTIGTSVETSRAAVSLAEREPDIYAAVGIHPHDASEADEAAFEELQKLTESSPRVVAIGETGLDLFRNLSPREVQVKVFRRQLDLARRAKKPVLIHCRDAHAETVEMLRAEGVREIGGIMHCFSGDEAVARQCLDLGLLISIAGPITYPNARKLPTVVKMVPADRLVVETDCPFLPPQPYRGKRNEPAYLPITAARVAELRGVPTDELGAQMATNALALFGIPSGQ
ncbi:MAG: TatD family hydrolase [Candidatus Rokubacteria bacterium]|nr:TatD family hydrolase [Candidatus Rokubacteria bacterium]